MIKPLISIPLKSSSYSSDRSIKELKERLLTARGTPNFDKVQDVNVICGCLKQFLLQLHEPLVTNESRSSFLNAIGKLLLSQADC